jgi:NAD(P)H-dependent FMN reductase
MNSPKNIFALIGSAGKNSANLKLVHKISEWVSPSFQVTIADKLSALPPFDPELSLEDAPPSIITFRQQVLEADAVLICTPEYIFSIPSCLKNVIEWCVATTVFSKKTLGHVKTKTSGKKRKEKNKI